MRKHVNINADYCVYMEMCESKNIGSRQSALFTEFSVQNTISSQKTIGKASRAPRALRQGDDNSTFGDAPVYDNGSSNIHAIPSGLPTIVTIRYREFLECSIRAMVGRCYFVL